MIETEDTVGAPVGSGLTITCSKDDLVHALGVVSRAVSSRTSVQILSGILLEPEGSATRVIWVMYGPLNFFPGKLMSVFTTMDKMIGDDFQKGLANLKAAAEK